MLIESVATSLVVGKARGGKFKNLGEINLKKYYLFIIGFGLEFLSVYLNKQDLGVFNEILNKYFIIIHSISYALVFIGLIYNFDKKSIVIVFIGTLLNYIVIVANGGHMPVSESGLSYLGMEQTMSDIKNNLIITHTIMTEKTSLFFLGDVIPTPKFYPFEKMISIGDVFLGIGVFILIHNTMLKKTQD